MKHEVTFERHIIRVYPFIHRTQAMPSALASLPTEGKRTVAFAAVSAFSPLSESSMQWVRTGYPLREVACRLGSSIIKTAFTHTLVDANGTLDPNCGSAAPSLSP